MSQIDTTQPDVAAVPVVSAKEMPFVHRLFAKVFRPSVRQAVVVLFDQGFCSIANFLTGVFVARACSKAEYGLYVLGFTLLMTAMGIQASLSGTPFTVLSPRLKPGERRLYLGSTLIQHLVVSALAAVGFIIAAGVLVAVGRTDCFANVLLALAAASVFMLLRDFMRYVLLAQLRVWASLLMGLAANILTVGMLFWAYTRGWLTAPVAYIILGGCSGLPVLLFLLSERKQIAFATNKLYQHVKENFHLGKWLIARTAAFFFAVQIYPLTLAAIRGPGAAAVYGACLGLASVLNPLFLGMDRFIGPKTAHAANQGFISVRRVVCLSIVAMCGPLLLLVSATVLFGGQAIVAVYGKNYTGLGGILLLIMVNKSLGGLVAPLSNGINALRRPEIVFIGHLFAAGVSLIIGLPLVYAVGAFGAAIGLLLATISRAVYLWAFFVKRCPNVELSKIPRKDFFKMI